jgi:transposase
VGIDRGVAVTLALSDGTRYQAPTPVPIREAAQALSRGKRGSTRRKRATRRLARLHTRNTDRRKDWAEKTSTQIARRYDTIRVEDLKVANMVRSAGGTIERPGRKVGQKAGLNRTILNAGWTLFATGLEHKALGRVEKVPAVSQPALLGLRTYRTGQSPEPSSVPVRRPRAHQQRRPERGTEHSGGTRRAGS